MSSEAILQVGTAVITLIGAIITYIIISYIKTKTIVEQQKNNVFWVGMAVNAAEQIFKEQGLGPFKKEYVISFLEKQALKICPLQLEVLIEAAVHELNMSNEFEAGA